MTDLPKPAAKPDRRAFWLSVVRFAFVVLALGILVVVVWSQLAAVEGDGITKRVEQVIGLARTGTWAPVIGVVLLTLLNVAGVPLMVLTAGATVVFDDILLGFSLSWMSSMIGASAGFGLGRWSGQALLQDFGGARINALSAKLGRRGALFCFLIRLVPTAPAIVVNMAIGTSHIPFGKFVLGTGLGIAPKLAMITVVTKGLLDLDTAQGPFLFAGLAALVLFWFATMALLRRAVRRVSDQGDCEAGLEQDGPEQGTRARPWPRDRDESEAPKQDQGPEQGRFGAYGP